MQIKHKILHKTKHMGTPVLENSVADTWLKLQLHELTSWFFQCWGVVHTVPGLNTRQGAEAGVESTDV
jgi:hypothetical protein